QAATAVYHAGSFSGSWPSMMEITVRTELAERTLDLTVKEQNTGQVPTPAGVGWHPVFALAGDRPDVRIVIPSITKVDIDHRTNLPSGKTVLTGGTTADLIRARGTRLDEMSLNDTYTNLQSGLLGDGPIAEIRDPAAVYGLRLIPLTANIKFLRVEAPAGERWISIEPDTNVDDPFGHEWPNPDDTGIVSLQPGESLQWHVRLEIFSLATPPLPPTANNPTPAIRIRGRHSRSRFDPRPRSLVSLLRTSEAATGASPRASDITEFLIALIRNFSADFIIKLPPILFTERQILSPTETTHEETFSATPEAAAAEAQHDHDHDHAGHEHHHHPPAPTLNPELTRSIEVEAPAADVDKAFRQVTRRYAKMARIPGFRAGKVP